MLAGEAPRVGRVPPGREQERKPLSDSLIYL